VVQRHACLVAWKEGEPSARLDLLSYRTQPGWQEEKRVVVTNHGPATMRKIDVQAFDEGGNFLAPRCHRSLAENARRIPAVLATQLGPLLGITGRTPPNA
jgi:hypothetical protein